MYLRGAHAPRGDDGTAGYMLDHVNMELLQASLCCPGLRAPVSQAGMPGKSVSTWTKSRHAAFEPAGAPRRCGASRVLPWHSGEQASWRQGERLAIGATVRERHSRGGLERSCAAPGQETMAGPPLPAVADNMACEALLLAADRPES